MTKPGPKKNSAASVRDRLLQLARTRNESFNFVLVRYAIERLLYRLSMSPHGSSFVLKGASLFTVWSGHPHRATKDIDLLGTGSPDLDRLRAIFSDICDVDVADDGATFDSASVKAARIKEEASYEGARVLVRGKLGSATLAVQIDIGFGDAMSTAPVLAEFPSLLDLPTAKVHIYPRETVVAEKLEAMVQLGIANSRMKDFFDLRFLARSFDFDGDRLTAAIAATFARRETAIPRSDPVAFTTMFTHDSQKNALWTGFLKRAAVAENELTLPSVVVDIRAFLDEPLESLRGGLHFAKTWSARRARWAAAVRSAESA